LGLASKNAALPPPVSAGDEMWLSILIYVDVLGTVAVFRDEAVITVEEHTLPTF
jgi:hypothetical protein